MKSNLSLGKFRNEIGTYSRFMLEYDDPLTPLAFSTQFSHASVILSASPYIALKNGVDFLCLTHIQSIKKKGKRMVTRFISSYVVTIPWTETLYQ